MNGLLVIHEPLELITFDIHALSYYVPVVCTCNPTNSKSTSRYMFIPYERSNLYQFHVTYLELPSEACGKRVRKRIASELNIRMKLDPHIPGVDV